MSFLTKLKKNLLFILVLLFSVFANCNSASANPTTPTSKKSRLNFFLYNTPGKTQHCIKYNSKTQEELEKIKRYLDKHCIIIDGGVYGNTASMEGYEVHHLISSSFCRKHGLLSRYSAPSVSIPRELHKMTGSHPSSRMSNEYLKKEEELYSQTHSLKEIYLMGIEDLKRALRLYAKERLGIDDYNVELEITHTPCKKAYESAEVASLKKGEKFKKIEKKGGSEKNPLSPKTLFN